MPFDNNALISLLTGSGFTLFLYRTPDTRAAVLAPNYFAPANARLETGDIIIAETSDAVALLPVRTNDVVAPGLVLDSSSASFAVSRTAAQRFSVFQAASAVAMTILLAPLAAGIMSNGFIDASATIAGPVAEIAFSINDATGTTVRGPLNSPVVSGMASASLPAPPVGTGYRLRAQSTLDEAVVATSPPFAVTAPFTLLQQDGTFILLQDGPRLPV